MFVVRRLRVTLLELLLVIAILALVAGLVAIKIHNAIVDQRFRTEVSLVVDDLRLAQDLMLILGTDVHVHFKQTEEGLKRWLELETALPDNIQREVMRKRKNLTAVTMSFNDLNNPNTVPGEIDVRFLSKGSIMSRGIIHMTNSINQEDAAGVLRSSIVMSGYPQPIFSTEGASSSEEERRYQSAVEENEKLTMDTIHRLPEKVKKINESKKRNEENKSDESQKPPPKNSTSKPQQGKNEKGS